MRSVVFSRPNEYELTDVPCPEVRTGHVLLTVRSTTVCGTDVKMLNGKVPYIHFPHIPGHEFGGEVAEIGEGVSGFSVGDKVGVEVHVGCGSCVRCLEGLYNLCLNYGDVAKGHAHIGFTVPGGLAEYCLVPAQAIHKLPDGLDFDHGAFTDTVGIVLWAIERAGGVRPGETVAVIGPGALGLLAVQAAKAFGAGKILALGAPQDVHRLQLAAQLGADYTLNLSNHSDPLDAVRSLTGGSGADLVLEFGGTSAAGNLALQITRRGGRVVLGGATSPGNRLDVDISTIVRGHLSVFGTVANPKRISHKANTLMQQGPIDIKPLITHRFSLDAFKQAWGIFTDRSEHAIRVMLHPGGAGC